MDIDLMTDEMRLGPEFPLPPDLPFTWAQARDAGITDRQMRRLLATELLRRPVKSVYLGSHVEDSVRVRAECLRLVTPEDCVVVDRHAGWLHGAEMVLAPNEHLALRPLSLFRPSGHGRLRNKLSNSGERNLTDADITIVHGLRVSTPLRTAWDLGRVRWPDTAIAALDAMLRLERFSKDQLIDGVERFRRMRWVTVLRAVVLLADGRAESPGESVLRLRCIENGLRGMEPQVEVWSGGRLIARLDLADVERFIAVEYDGAEWHSSPDQQAHDEARRDRAGDEGWRVVPFKKEHVFGRSRECDRMLAELREEARKSTRRS
jgi:hypothetical protein